MASDASAVSGSMFGAVGGLMQGQAQANSLDTAAEIQRQNSDEAIQAGNYNADRNDMLANSKIGAGTAGYGASGVTANSGSVLNVLAMSHANAELDKQNILHGADIKAINYNNQASMDELGAKSALQGSYFNALSSVMMGGSKVLGNSSGASTAYSVNQADTSAQGMSTGADETADVVV